MTIVIRVVGTADETDHPFFTNTVGKYLAGFDLNAEPHGCFDWTEDINEAYRFPTGKEAFEAWRRQSEAFPTRAWDGLPNRPLTAWTVEVLEAP